MDKRQQMEQFRRAFMMFTTGLSDDDAMEVATIFEPWKVGKVYKENTYVTHGVNEVGDPQLYKVNAGKTHTSQADWTPDVTPSLFTPIGLDEEGHTVWSAPTGAHDAYAKGDIVNYNGILYESQIDGNTTVPGTDDRYWTEVTE